MSRPAFLLHASRWLAALGMIAASPADVVINEIQSSNGSTLLDEDGDPSDWIELRNRGTEAIDLEGWGISDRTDDPYKWTFPGISLAAGERLLVWASGKDRSGTITGPSFDSPDDIPGLVMWLRAEGQVYTEGQAATAWTDLSSSGNDVTAPAIGNRPVFRTNRINGKPAFQFTRNSAHEFRKPAPSFTGMDTLNDMTLYTVARWQGGVSSGIFGAWHSVSNPANSHFEVNSGGEVRFRVGGMDSIRTTGAITTGEWSVLSGTMAGSGDTPLARLYKNGELIGTKIQSPGDALLGNLEHVSIGSSTAGRNFGGDIAEVLIYNRELTSAERAFLDGHLGIRYNLPGAAASQEAQLHTNFSIASEGEDIVLTRPDGTTESMIPAVAIPQDASYGRNPESGSSFGYFSAPTPRLPNATISYGPPVTAPLMSEPRGFKTASFNLALTHPDPAVTIHYTLDGSEPTESTGTVYTAPVFIGGTAVVRAAGFKTGALPQRTIATRSYLFLDDIITRTSAPAGYPATWNGFAQTSYGLSPFVAAQAGYAAKMKAALQSFPTLAISLAPGEMFGSNGVYSNPLVRDFEKIVSAEWITPDGSLDVQIDAGLRIQGGASREFANTPKKSMRLLFKGEYGEGRLRAPVLSEGGTQMADFNSIVLRADYNNSWLHWESAQRGRATTLRDQFMRDSQIAMSGLGSHGNHVHLYVNGIYWGVYNPSERPDAAFSASYLGGEREDYDAMTHRGVRDGDNIAWNTMRALAETGLSTPAQYAAIQQYLDVDQFIDYMILNLYGGNDDWPNNNWNATRLRQEGAGYMFFAWDAERTLENPGNNRVNVTGTNNPAEFYAALRNNAEFRLRFADHVHRHFFNAGALTPAANISRYSNRAAKVETGVFAEEARWGAYRNEIFDRGGPSPRYALDPHWLAERDRLLNVYFPSRTATVLSQFKAANLYPSVDAPSFSQHGGELPTDQSVTISAPLATIYYTQDGSDPRIPITGAVSASAFAYTTPLTITGQKTLKARVLSGGVWSALAEATFYTAQPESIFTPAGSADWTLNTSWTPSPYPDGPGKRALIEAPTGGDRNISIRVPVTVGSIRFDEQNNLYRNRVRDQLIGKTLTFDGGGQEARVQVDGNGTGFVEFEVLAGTVLESDLEVQVNHLGGNEEHGALRLRAAWSGPGGIRKTGPGVVSLTGEDKNFSGALEIQQGVIQLTEPSTPRQASAVSVAAGGQLRLTSGSDPEVPRVYDFATPLLIAGQGRGSPIPDDTGYGKQGALRYDPGNGENHAVLPQPVQLTAASVIHVDGAGNRLELAAPLAGAFELTKSGAGMLSLSTANAGFTSPIMIANGGMEITGSLGAPISIGATGTLTGHGVTGPLSGDGTLLLKGSTISTPSISGGSLVVTFATEGSPDYTNSAASGNGLLRVESLPTPPASCRFYLPESGDIFRGGIFAPFDVDLATATRGISCEVFRPDINGTHVWNGMTWTLATNAQVVTVAETADFPTDAVDGRIIEIRTGAGSSSFATWKLAAFPDESDRSNPAISGPEAKPWGDGIANLIRYALGVPAGESPHAYLPQLTLTPAGLVFNFPFDSGRDDIACLVETTPDLTDWSQADVIFDSRTDFPTALEAGRLAVADPASGAKRFYRLRVIPLP